MTDLEKEPNAIFPWQCAELREWSIVGMNHYHVQGEKWLFVAMAKRLNVIPSDPQMYIVAEGIDCWAIWENLTEQAKAAEARVTGEGENNAGT